MRTIASLLNTVQVTANATTRAVERTAVSVSKVVDVVDHTTTGITNFSKMFENWSSDQLDNQIKSRETRAKADKVTRAIEEVKLDDALEELFKLQDERANRMNNFEERKAKFFAE